MKLAFFTRVASALGVVVLATAISAGMQPLAQAQMDVSVPTDIDDEACLASGFNSFYLLQDIALSYEQIERIYELSALQAEASERQMDSFPAVDNLGGGHFFVSRPGAEITPEIQEAMDIAARNITSGEAVRGQITALNEQFGQYGEFLIWQDVILTPERRAEIRQLDADFESRYESVLTPQQQRQYRENLATESKINEACGIVKNDRSNYEFSRSPEPTFLQR